MLNSAGALNTPALRKMVMSLIDRAAIWAAELAEETVPLTGSSCRPAAGPLPGRCLAAAWPLLGRCLDAAWTLLGRCRS